MHDQPAEEYEWPTCAAGPAAGAHSHYLWENELDRLVCRPCEETTASRIRELPGLHQQLDSLAALMRGSRRGGSPSGTRTPPIPPRLDTLALVGPGGIAARLQAIEDSWRQALGWKLEIRQDAVRVFAPWRSNPKTAVPAHVRFLANNLLWACSSYESIGQDIDEIRRLHAECKAILEQNQKPGRVKIGLCPVVTESERCGQQLTASSRSFKTTCTRCGETWEGEHEWRQLRTAQERALAETDGIAA